MEDIGEERSYTSVDEEVVGFDGDAQNIFFKVISGIRKLDIISIVGTAGIGKTTLARKVYNDPQLMHYFDVRAWGTISQKYSERKLLLDILRQINRDWHVDLDVGAAADMLHSSLMRRRYLIVLDDIWDVTTWDELSRIFPDTECGSKIIITTRVTKLAKELSHHSDPYFLSFLSDKQSWELLHKKAFQGERCPPELRGAGARIAKISKGLPLVIIMIATTISKIERQASLWLDVAKDISSRYFEEEIKMIRPIYDRLEDHLKPCLLYMGLFPTRYEIPVSDLFKWWMAEDLVQHSGASEYFLDDLVDRDLVIVSKRKTNGEMKYCKVLDQVREFCVRKIAEEKFMQVRVSEEQRLCMYIHENMVRESFGQRQIPLEFIVHPKFSKLDRRSLFPFLNNLRLVRVLDLLDIYLQDSWADAFQELTHLRYLAIFLKVFDIKWVSHLPHLQTLRVRSSFTMISPAIWKMTTLVHVDINEFSVVQVENARVNFKGSSETVLDNLKTLGMCSMSVADMTSEFWGRFPNLEELRLNIDEFENVHNVSLLDKTNGYAKCLVFPSSLTVLSLSDVFLTDEIVSSMAKLKCLETLKLSEIYFTGEQQHLDLGDNEFNALKVFKLHRVFMTKWHISENSFPLPVLEQLVIKSCSKLEEIPEGVTYIDTLQEIRVINCRDAVGLSAQAMELYKAEIGDHSLKVHILKSKDSK